jgi:ABC-type multidrug transport system fused ATPase/permease subunit
MSLAAIAVVSATALLTTGGSFDPAAIPVALILAAGAFAPLASLTGTLREVGQVSAAAERIVVLMDAEPVVVDRVDEAASASRRPPRDGSLRVAFDDVRFRYAADLPDVVRDVSFAVEPGETVALVGHSGAGKSTCANLLLRLWDVDAGAVRVGGTDIRDLLLHDLRPLIAVVPQDVYLFHTSVADNLRLGNPDAGEEQLERAARLAQATGFIELLPDGFETVLGERGASISGGQRQRLAIARALLRDAPILVMDEAVANLDAESEAALRDAMAEVARDRTTLLIAHRPSTIRTADRVVVLDHGRVVETGTYDALLRSGGHLSALLAGSPAIVDPDA